jgi:membrane protein involved in colicin uptake
MREKTEAEWQAEDDARSLAQAEEIKADKARLDKAQSAAKRMADEEAERAKAMRKVAGRKKSQPSGGGGSKRKPMSTRLNEAPVQGAPGNSFNVFEKV